jgi:hypothetical protein
MNASLRPEPIVLATQRLATMCCFPLDGSVKMNSSW